MADPKETKLSIVVRTVDQATAKIKAINDRLDAVTKPMRDFRSALSDLREKSGLNGVIDGFKGVGSSLVDVLGKLAMIGGIAGAATGALLHIVDGFDELGDKAEEAGVSVDFLAQMRYAAERSGAAVQNLDGGLTAFSKSLGQARAGTGRMAGFLEKVYPPLLKQLKATKSNEEAFTLLSDAMTKLKDPAKRAALAAATVGDASLAPLLAKGSDGIKELRDRYFQLAGSQEDAVSKSGAVDDAMKDLKASTDGIKAALAAGLAPALKVIVERLSQWFTAHRADVAAWAAQIGEKLPGAIAAVVEWVGKAKDKVAEFIDKIGGLKTVAIALGAVLLAGPVASLVKLGSSMVDMVHRVGSLAGSFAKAGEGAGGFGTKVMGLLGPIGLAIAAAEALNEITGGSIGAGEGGAMGIAEREINRRKLASQGRTEVTDAVFKAMGGVRPDVSAQAGSALGAASRSISTETKVTVDFANAPRGTRVRTDPQSTGDVDLNVGYQMAGAM